MAVVTTYNFTQEVDYPNLLVSNVQSSSISTPLINIETSGSGQTMSVSLVFSDVLSGADQATLNSIMSSYTNTIPALQATIEQVTKDINFGMSIIAQFGAANRIANLSTSEIAQISQQLSPIQALLMSGSIQTALVSIQNLTPTTLLTQDTINNYVSQIQAYLGSGQQ